MRKFIIFSAAAIFLLAACNEPYDPIGRNRPAPVLLISPLELAFDGDGGSLVSNISTNAESITIGDLPEWIEDVTVSEDLASVTVTTSANKASSEPRRGTVRLICASGDNSATQYMRVYQAGKGCNIAFTPFSGKNYPSGWTAEDQNTLSIGNGYVSIKSDDVPGYIYTCNTEFDPSAVRYYFSVDMKMSGEGGAKLYVNDNPLQVVEIYLGYNAAANRGGIWVKNGETWYAMDDGVIGSGTCDNQYGEMVPLADPSERDDWWRLVVFTTETAPNQPVVQVQSLRTFNGEVLPLGVCYSRKFSFAKATAGRVALWGRNYESQFRNFLLSYQK